MRLSTTVVFGSIAGRPANARAEGRDNLPFSGVKPLLPPNLRTTTVGLVWIGSWLVADEIGPEGV